MSDYFDQLEADYLSNRHDESVYGYENDSGCRPPFVTCKHCGKDDLVWKRTKDGFRTASIHGVIHRCPKFNKNEQNT